jgi:hypothetical protein
LESSQEEMIAKLRNRLMKVASTKKAILIHRK